MATVQDILDQVAWQADLENSVGTSKRLDPTKLIPQINSANKEAWRIAVKANEDWFIKKVTDFPIVGGVGANTYSLAGATDFYKPKSIQRLNGSVYGPPLPTHPWNQIGNVDELSYRLQDSAPATVYFEPELSCAGTYRLWYVYTPAELTAAVNPIVDPLGGAIKQFIEDTITMRVTAREEEATDLMEKLVARFSGEVADAASGRNVGRGRKIADTRQGRRFRFMTKSGYSLP